MPGGSSLEMIPELRAMIPETQIVVLTMQAQPATVRAARAAGALGYVLKEAADAELVEAVHRAALGERYINRRVAASLVAERMATEGWD
jgi:two-component system response regulator NreC